MNSHIKFLTMLGQWTWSQLVTSVLREKDVLFCSDYTVGPTYMRVLRPISGEGQKILSFMDYLREEGWKVVRLSCFCNFLNFLLLKIFSIPKCCIRVVCSESIRRKG